MCIRDRATAPGRLSGQARIAPALMAQVQPTDTVFILARPASGSRMPLAVLRLRAADLPRAFTLDDSNAIDVYKRQPSCRGWRARR